MTALRVLFYVLAVMIVVSTALAITRRNLVHAVIYLIQSFFATAVLFYLLGAPVLAALEIIIYAGAIMVLFLFIIMTLVGGYARAGRNYRQWILPSLLGMVSLAASGVLLLLAPAAKTGLVAASASPAAFGRHLFDKYWLPIEIVSFLLFVALVGALYLGTHKGKSVAQIEVEQ